MSNFTSFVSNLLTKTRELRQLEKTHELSRAHVTNCRGHFSRVTVTFLLILSEAPGRLSRTNFVVFVRGTYCRGTFFKSLTNRKLSRKKKPWCETTRLLGNMNIVKKPTESCLFLLGVAVGLKWKAPRSYECVCTCVWTCVSAYILCVCSYCAYTQVAYRACCAYCWYARAYACARTVCIGMRKSAYI